MKTSGFSRKEHQVRGVLNSGTTLLLILLLIAFAIRTVGIVQIPPGLSGDESMNGTDAMRVWGRERLPVFFTSNFGREAFFLYLMALSVKLGGVSPFTIRLPAILCGMGGIVLTYILVKRLWRERAALLTVGLLSISFWPVFTSRVGLRAVSMLPWQALCLYALWRGLTERRWIWWGVTGVALGVLTHTYIPGRFFAVVPVMWIGVCAACSPHHPWDGADRRKLWAGMLIAVGIALLIFLPLGRFIARHPDQANQRIRELDYILRQLQVANFQPLWQAIVRTLGKFTFRGEGDWYYNVAERPLFDWGTGILFYAGVLLALRQWRDPRYQLLLIWTGAMLAPAIFAAGAPSFLRATGAQIPLYIYPALAFDALWRRLDNYVRRSNPVLLRHIQRRMAWIAGAGLALIALNDGQAYFVRWAQEPRTREIYNAGLAQVGAAIDAHSPLPDNARVMVGCDYAADLCRDMVRFQTQYTGPIQWFVGRNALVFPQTKSPRTPSDPGDVFYFFGDALPPDIILQPWELLGDTLTTIRSADGALESAKMRIPGEQRAQHPWTPQRTPQRTPHKTRHGRFQNAITLLGYDLSSHVERGQSSPLVLYWQIPDDPALIQDTPIWFNLALRDEHGNIWDQRANLLPIAPWDWMPGDVTAQVIGFPIPTYTPPITLYLDFGLERDNQPVPYHLPTGETTNAATLGPLQATGAPVVAPPDAAIPLGREGEITLGEQLMIGMASPGERLPTTLHWYALDTPHQNYAVRFQWRAGDCAGPVMHTVHEPLLADTYPTSHWQAGESLRSTHAPPIPRELEAGTYYVTLDLAPTEQPESAAADGNGPCHPVVISGRTRQFTPPDIPHPHEQPLSDGVKLLGYDLTPAGPLHPRDTVEVTLYWQAAAAPDQGYTVFVHLYRSDGQLAGQHDGPPCGGECPTFSWMAGEVLVDKHMLTVDPAAEDGPYRLGVGMYDLLSLERLPVPQAEDDVIFLTSITVQK